jgi:hypothetical protein
MPAVCCLGYCSWAMSTAIRRASSCERRPSKSKRQSRSEVCPTGHRAQGKYNGNNSQGPERMSQRKISSIRRAYRGDSGSSPAERCPAKFKGSQAQRNSRRAKPGETHGIPQ